MPCKMLLFGAAISSFSAAEPQALQDTWVPPKKGNLTSSKMAFAETCGKSNENESSECVRSSQASSDKDSSSPLLIKTAFAVISEDMIR